MNLKKKRVIKIIAFSITSGLIIGLGIFLYMFNMPHRNIQNADTDFSLSSTQIVNEYLSDANAANNKFLADDGESKIIEVSGIVASISQNYNGQKVVLLKEKNEKAGVSCTFLANTGINAMTLNIGERTIIKGVIRSGAAYDADLEIYEHVILDKCDILK